MEIEVLAWLVRYEAWFIAGLVLIAADMLFGLEFFALSLGISAVLTAILLLIFGAVGIALPWQVAVAVFAVDSVAILIPLRKWLNREKAEGGSDINDY